MHKNAETGEIGMLVVFFDQSKGNFDSEFIRAFFDTDPEDVFIRMKVWEILRLTKYRRYWNYMGSLTVPPCTEGVSWTIIDDAQPISQD